MRHNKDIYDFFQYSITRSKALLYIQDGIDIILESKGNFIPYLQDKYPKIGFIFQGFTDLTVAMTDIFDSSIEIKPKKVLEFEKKVKKHEAQIKKIVSSISQKELERAFQPLVKIFESVEMIYEYPLYYDAVVSSVTAFETYLKDTLVDLISTNRKVEERFSEELQKELIYDKIKFYNYEWASIMGYVITEKISFVELNEVDRSYRRALGKTKGKFSIFETLNQKKKIQNFIKLRHLIVHNAGMVDHKFKKETRCKYQIGRPYPLSKKYVEDMMGSMSKVIDKIEKEIKKS